MLTVVVIAIIVLIYFAVRGGPALGPTGPSTGPPSGPTIACYIFEMSSGQLAKKEYKCKIIDGGKRLELGEIKKILKDAHFNTAILFVYSKLSVDEAVFVPKIWDIDNDTFSGLDLIYCNANYLYAIPSRIIGGGIDKSISIAPQMAHCRQLVKYPNANFFAAESAPGTSLVYLRDNSTPTEEGISKVASSDKWLAFMEKAALNCVTCWYLVVADENTNTIKAESGQVLGAPANWFDRFQMLYEFKRKTKFGEKVFIYLQMFAGGGVWCKPEDLKDCASSPVKSCFFIPVEGQHNQAFEDQTNKLAYNLCQDQPNRVVFLATDINKPNRKCIKYSAPNMPVNAPDLTAVIKP